VVIDSHCHLADTVFVDDLGEVVARAQAAGVDEALCILSADEAEEVARAVTVARAWPAVKFAAAIHPHRAGAYAGRPQAAADLVGAVATQVGAMVVGEIGLDYHYDFAPRDVQREVFAAQVALAVTRALPVAIHTREATDDTLEVLRATGGRVRGVFHCFSGTIDEARAALDLGFYLSLSGIVTFPKAGSLRDVAVFVPEDRLLLETDAPFLAPVPHRGKRNEPAWVSETLAVVARTRGVGVDTLAASVGRNFHALIGEWPGVHAR
jgi:TatD DNase family protein